MTHHIMWWGSSKAIIRLHMTPNALIIKQKQFYWMRRVDSLGRRKEARCWEILGHELHRLRAGGDPAWGRARAGYSFRITATEITAVQSLSCVQLCDPMDCSTPGFPVLHHLRELAQTHVHRVSDAIQPSHPLLSPSLPAPNPSQHQSLFQWVNSSHEVAKVLEFQLQHQSFQWTPGLISFRMAWLDLLAVQGTPKSLLQHHGSNTSIDQHSAFFTVQLSHPYMTIGKTIALTIHTTTRTFVGKVITLIFNMLSRLVILSLQGVRVF